MSDVPPSGYRARLERKTGLERTRLRRRAPTRIVEAGRQAWMLLPHAGFCQCGCGKFSLHLHRHHVVTEQHVRREGGDPWATANQMLLHEKCHTWHHSGFHRIPLDRVPPEAVEFAVRLLGEDRAVLYLTRYYGGSDAS